MQCNVTKKNPECYATIMPLTHVATNMKLTVNGCECDTVWIIKSMSRFDAVKIFGMTGLV